jgi:hypothetical protein
MVDHRHPWSLITAESLFLQSLDAIPSSVFPSQDDWFDNRRQEFILSEPIPNESTQKVTRFLWSMPESCSIA